MPDFWTKGLTKRQKYELRKLRKRQVEQSYREHTPSQVRYGRFLARVERVNPRPSVYLSELPAVRCGWCNLRFNPKHIASHVARKHERRRIDV